MKVDYSGLHRCWSKTKNCTYCSIQHIPFISMERTNPKLMESTPMDATLLVQDAIE